MSSILPSDEDLSSLGSAISPETYVADMPSLNSNGSEVVLGRLEEGNGSAGSTPSDGKERGLNTKLRGALSRTQVNHCGVCSTSARRRELR